MLYRSASAALAERMVHRFTSAAVAESVVPIRSAKETIISRFNETRFLDALQFCIYALSVLVDPFLCYTVVVNMSQMCINLDGNLIWAILFFRFTTDLYFLAALYPILASIGKSKAKQILIHSLAKVTHLILAGFPIPEAVVMYGGRDLHLNLIVLGGSKFNLIGLILFLFTLQYTLRLIIIYGSKRWTHVKEKIWIRHLLALLPFIIAAHTNTVESSFILRFLQSFWWALRNLSSFGSNLPTSGYMLEILFSLLTSISGLTLFLVYLNASVKEMQDISDQRKLKEKKQSLNSDVDFWFAKAPFGIASLFKKSAFM